MKHHILTKLAHMGTAPCDAEHPIAPVALPSMRTSTVRFNTVSDLHSAYKQKKAGERKVVYGRMGLDTHIAFENMLCELEGGKRAFLASSGLNAIALTVLSLLKSGDHMLAADCVYGPLREIDKTLLQRFNISTDFCSMQDIAAVEARIKPNTRLLFIESPGSLLYETLDIPALSALAKKHNLILVCDNTWGSGHVMKALELGCDVSVIAVTKYIGGHSDLLMGAVVLRDDNLIRQVSDNYLVMGYSVSADDVWLAIRGVRTMDVRMKRHAENALAVCDWFAQQAQTLQIYHPAYPQDPGHALWQRDCLGSNGMVSIALDLNKKQAIALADALELFSIGYSWGGYESLVDVVDVEYLRDHSYWNPAYPSLIRLHVGIEEVGDLIADLDQALKIALQTV